MIEKGCMNYDGDDDCHKCCKQGYIFSCPDDCEDYINFFGHKHKKDGDDNGDDESRNMESR